MKKTLTMILLFSEILLLAQAKPYLDYHKGTKIIKRRGLVLNNTFHKEWKYYTKLGKLEAVGNWDKGQKQGEWKFFDDNGILELKGSYDNNVKTGEWKYYVNGVIQDKETYLNGKKNGKYVKYFKGKLLGKGNFKENKAYGKWKGFYTKGTHEGKTRFELIIKEENNTKQLVTEFLYNEKQEYTFSKPYFAEGSVIFEKDKDNSLDISFFTTPEYYGKYKGYYKDGKLLSTGEYTLDEKSGIWTYYYKNGKIWGKGEFNDGNEIGIWTYYHKNGELKEIGRYDRKGKINKWRYYHDNKQPRGEIEYIENPKGFENCPVGTQTNFHKNGTISSKIVYGGSINNGKCPKRLSEIFYNKKGEITYYQVGREDGYSKYSNGSVRFEWFYNNNIYSEKEYFENGKLKEESFKKYNPKSDEYDIKTGIWKFYNEDGSLKESIDYSKKR